MNAVSPALFAEAFAGHFAKGPGRGKIAELAKASSWERGSVVEKSGYALMPGSKTTNSDVARACAEMLRQLRQLLRSDELPIATPVRRQWPTPLPMPEARCGTTVARISVDRKSTASDGAALRELLAPDAAKRSS